MVNKLSAIILFLLLTHLYAIPSFPGAEGYGADTPGGRGGQVLFVTNLNSTGPGSFRTAMVTPGPRIIVFRVSGVIRLDGKIQLDAENLSYVTIAGQTSPGGVTISAASGTPVWQYTNSKFHDAIWRFLRFRVNTSNNDHAFEQYMSYDWVVDHCDYSGGTDETFDACRVHDVTIQWCTITNSGPNGQHCGLLMGYNPAYDITIHHNLFANHIYRGPVINWHDNPAPNFGMVDYRNNVAHNFYTHVVRLKKSTTEVRANMVGNWFKEGPSHDASAYQPAQVSSLVKVYEHDNVYDSDRLASMKTYPELIFDTRSTTNVPTRMSGAWDMPPVTTTSKEQAYEDVLNKAGAWPRDAMNVRTVAEVRAGTGELGKVDDPMIESGPNLPDDSDMDGMPDCWETYMGFNPNNAADNNGDHDGDGYTNVEEYINDLALALTGGTPANGMLECGCPTAVEKGPAQANDAMTISVSPNPFRSSVTISWANLSGTKLAIYDSHGRMVHRTRATAPYTWNAKGLPGGVYIIRLACGNSQMVRKVFILK